VTELDVARTLTHDALSNLEAHRVRINQLNVYPVPDGDTGTNMTGTVRFIVDALDASQATGHEAVAKELSLAALMGARGNSGVILSQIVRGLAEVLGKRAEIDAATIRDALRSASDEARSAIMNPVHGTMLTVMEAMATAAASPEARALENEQLLALVVERGDTAVAETQNQLAKLRDAGVVDAGGVGLVEILRGVYFSVAGIAVPDVASEDDDGYPELEHEFSEFRYCTNFVVEGTGLNREALSDALWLIGDSLHVVGDASMLRVHVHTDDPEGAIAVARALGTVIDPTCDVADMDEQIRERLPDLQTAVVVVASGTGNRRLFERKFGEVIVIAGGQTANPSAKEIADAIESAHAPEVIVLPNNRNIVGAAVQATEFTSKNVRIVETESLQAGLLAVNEAYTHSDTADDNVNAMKDVLDGLLTGEVTTASRTATVDGIEVREGEWLGLVDGRVVVCNTDFDEVALGVARGVLAGGADTFTAIVGGERPQLDGFWERFRQEFPRVDPEEKDGGQPHYPLLVFA
jgi:DAK2 domain fusion protein YloV